MTIHNVPSPATLADVLKLIERAELSADRRRDLASAMRRLCEMAGCSPINLCAEAPLLRETVAKIRPAAHGLSKKTFANLRSLFASSLQHAGVLDSMGRGCAKAHADWAPLIKAIAHDKRLSNGMAAFANWCAVNDIPPRDIDNDDVQSFLQWLESRTLHPRPRDLVRRVPNLWNEARDKIAGWPQSKLARLTFRGPSKHLTWNQLDPDLRHDVESYLTMRAKPDLFDERPNAPTRPLAPSTLKQQSEHLRLAASVLVQKGTPIDDITSLANLVEHEAVKTVLRHYHAQAEGKPNAFVIGLGKTLIQVARYHLGATDEQIDTLKTLTAKLPDVPYDLTEKNKALLRQFDSELTKAKLLFLPQTLLAEVMTALDQGPLRFVDAQIAIAIDIMLIAPLRPQNICGLNWTRHINEPDGPKGRLLLHIPAQETKTKRQDLTFDLPADLAQRLRWYRRHILPRLDGDPNGDLFVTRRGTRKGQGTLTDQIIERIERHVGIHMTPHQFRHLAAKLYLDEHPEDFETVRALLGHAFAKTTLIYAGAANQRASKTYSNFVLEQRDALNFKRRGKRNRKKLKTQV